MTRRDEKQRGDTLVEKVMQTIRTRIAERSIASGAKLPSIRSLAGSMQVSKSTVVEAYDRLVAEGVLQSRRGSGFYVAGHQPPLSLLQAGPKLDRAIDPVWMSRQALEAGAEVLKPGCGWLPASWMPDESIRRTLRSLSRSDQACLTDYGSPLGLAPLRQILARRLAEHGTQAMPDQIMLTESGTQAIDLLCRFLLEPGDTVLVDDPCYFNFHAMLRAHRVQVVSVPYTPTGPDIDSFSDVLATHRPRLYITNAAIHNPTGASLAPHVAHRLLRLAEQHDLTIIEDDIFADFELDPAPRLSAFDGLERVIHIGSFSKTLSASIRCGYIAARRDWIEDLVGLKLATSFGGGHFSQSVVWHLLKDGTYRRHVDGLKERLASSMGLVVNRLKACGLTPFVIPKGGLFLWCNLPDNLEASDIAQRALAENVVLAPGNVFSLSQSARGFLRFNIAQSLDPRVFTILTNAMDASAHGISGTGAEP